MILRKLPILLTIMISAYCVSTQAMTWGDDVDEYFHEIQASASKGDPAAETCLGELYADGIGTYPDSASALQWYKTAATSGDASGKLRVSQVYAYGIGIPQDTATALHMLDDLINEGYAPAKSVLAALYLDGVGVTKDEAKALALYREAAEEDDYEAQMRLGLFYHWGNHVEKNDTEAFKWLGKAANHRVYCLSSFGTLANFLINGYLKSPDPKRTSQYGAAGNLRIRYVYNNGRAEDVALLLSSGDQEEDQAVLNATRDAVLPPWPDSYRPKKKELGFMIPGGDGELDHDFISGIRKAVSAAEVMPLEVLLHGTNGLTTANVGFDYVDGRATNVKIVSPSNDANEDAAAVSAVKDAKYDATPREYQHKKLHITITVAFEYVAPTKAPSPTTVQSANNSH